MAIQMHIANSATIRGAGVFAGGPYYCAKGSITTALTNCMYVGTNIDRAGIKAQIKNYEQSGKIDASSNLSKQKAFIFSGVSDYTVVPKVGKEAEGLYKDLGVSVETKYDLAASHTMPTISYGTTCNISMPPYIGKWNYNGAFEALNYLFDRKLKQGSGKYNKNNLFSTPQNTSNTSMGSNAYVYVPEICKQSDAKCPLHVVFHGCKQTINDIQMQYVENTGYNEIAEDNGIVILYPQAVVTTSINPNGCWDWWGYLNEDYANKKRSTNEWGQ